MNIVMGLHAIAGDSSKFLVRPEGDIIQVTKNLSLRNCKSGAPKGWRPNVGALISEGWQVMTADQLMAMMTARAEQGA